MERGISFTRKDVLRAAERELSRANDSNIYRNSDVHLINAVMLILIADTLKRKQLYFIPSN